MGPLWGPGRPRVGDPDAPPVRPKHNPAASRRAVRLPNESGLGGGEVCRAALRGAGGASADHTAWGQEMARMAAAGTLPKWLADTDAAHFKALLYMFFACHIILVCQDGPRVDLRTLQVIVACRSRSQSPLMAPCACRRCGCSSKSRNLSGRRSITTCTVSHTRCTLSTCSPTAPEQLSGVVSVALFGQG